MLKAATRNSPREALARFLFQQEVILMTCSGLLIVWGSPVLALWSILLASGIFLTKFLKARLKVRPWQTAIGMALASFMLALDHTPAVSGESGGGLFGPIEEETNSVLDAAGASGISDQVTGVFGLLNIIAAVVAIGAIIYGVFEQRNGNTMRESFMPFMMVLLLYIGAQFVASMFLSA